MGDCVTNKYLSTINEKRTQNFTENLKCRKNSKGHDKKEEKREVSWTNFVKRYVCVCVYLLYFSYWILFLHPLLCLPRWAHLFLYT